MNRNLLILGAGQYGQVTKEVAQSMQCFDQIDFLDDNNPIAIDKIANYAQYEGQYDHAIVAIGNNLMRLSLIEKLRGVSFQITTLISPQAYVSPSVQLGEGSIVEPMAVVHSNSIIGIGCILSAGSVINHDCALGAGCHIDCNGIVPTSSEVPVETKVLCGQVYRKASSCSKDYRFEAGI